VVQIQLSTSSLSDGRWYEYLIRFELGGGATVLTGLISSAFGVSIGGLFLALPVIFCASATLIERHEIRRKRNAGGRGECRGRKAAALDAAGAALGSVAMVTFAMVFLAVSPYGAVAAFLCSAVVWILTAVSLWYARGGLECLVRRLGP
jgi:hypothetical protein